MRRRGRLILSVAALKETAITDVAEQPGVRTGVKVLLALVTGLIDAAGIAAALTYSFFVTAFIGVCTDAPDACNGLVVFYVVMAAGI